MPDGPDPPTLARRRSSAVLQSTPGVLDEVATPAPRTKLKTLHPVFLTFPDSQLEKSYRVRSGHRARKRAALFSALFTVSCLCFALTLWVGHGAVSQLALHFVAICISLVWAGACFFPVKAALYQYVIANWATPAFCVALVAVYGYSDTVSEDDGFSVMPVLLLSAFFVFIQALTTHAGTWGFLIPVIVLLETLAFLPVRPSVANALPLFEAWVLLIIIARGLEKIARRNYSLGRATFRAKIAYGEAEKKNNAILRNILPESVISAVRQGHMTAANRRYSQVTSIFLGLNNPPPTNTENIHTVMPVINGFISELEVLCDKHGVEKIKTIGFLFLAACGLPEEREGSEDAVAAAEFALDAVAAAKRFGFSARVGLARGPVVAGVVGARLTYDVFGDTVNTSNRMYYYCDPDSVTCNPSVYETLSRDAAAKERFEFPKTKEQQIKGKGLMKIYTLRRAGKRAGKPRAVTWAGAVGGAGVAMKQQNGLGSVAEEPGENGGGDRAGHSDDDEEVVEAGSICPGPLASLGKEADESGQALLPAPGGQGRRMSAPMARPALAEASKVHFGSQLSASGGASRWRTAADRVIASQPDDPLKERAQSLQAIVRAAASVAKMARSQAAVIAAAARAAEQARGGSAEDGAGSDSDSDVTIESSEEEEEGPAEGGEGAAAPRPPAGAAPKGDVEAGAPSSSEQQKKKGEAVDPRAARREEKRRWRAERRQRKKTVGGSLVDAILDEFEVGSEDEAEEDEELGKLEIELMSAGSYTKGQQEAKEEAKEAAAGIAAAGGIGAAGNRRISLQAASLSDLSRTLVNKRREELASNLSSTRVTAARFVARMARDVGLVRLRGTSRMALLTFDDKALDKEFWRLRFEDTLYPARRIVVFAFLHSLLWPVVELLGGVPDLANRAALRWAMSLPWGALLLGFAFAKKALFAKHLRPAVLSQLLLATLYTVVQCLYLDPTEAVASERHTSSFYLAELSILLLLITCMPGPAVRWMEALALAALALVPPLAVRRPLLHVEMTQLAAMAAMGLYHAWFHELEARHEFELERELSVREQQVWTELDESARLLTLCLPRPIVRAALEGRMEIGAMASQHYDTVAVLCADIVGFTPLSSTLDPQDLVRVLSELITECDSLADKHKIVRLKTIGDAWLAVAGMEGALDAAAAARLISLGLDIAKVFKEASARFQLAINVRIGIASGPCSGGIIGNKRWFWDLFGEAMDSAGSHEAGGVPGRVHVSKEVRLMVGDAFIFEPRHPAPASRAEGAEGPASPAGAPPPSPAALHDPHEEEARLESYLVIA